MSLYPNDSIGSVAGVWLWSECTRSMTASGAECERSPSLPAALLLFVSTIRFVIWSIFIQLDCRDYSRPDPTRLDSTRLDPTHSSLTFAIDHALQTASFDSYTHAHVHTHSHTRTRPHPNPHTHTHTPIHLLFILWKT